MPCRAGRRAEDGAPGVGAERGARPLACRRSLGRWPRGYLPGVSGRRRAPARCALRPARSDSSPAAPTPPTPPRAAAAAAAAARPPATLPLPLNSCAKYAALHLLGGSPAAPGSRAREIRQPRAPPVLRNPRPSPSLPFPVSGSGTRLGERRDSSQDSGKATAIYMLMARVGWKAG